MAFDVEGRFELLHAEWTLFAQFFYKLSTESEQAAMLFMNTERRNRGLDTSILNGSATSVAAQERSLFAEEKPRRARKRKRRRKDAEGEGERVAKTPKLSKKSGKKRAKSPEPVAQPSSPLSSVSSPELPLAESHLANRVVAEASKDGHNRQHSCPTPRDVNLPPSVTSTRKDGMGASTPSTQRLTTPAGVDDQDKPEPEDATIQIDVSLNAEPSTSKARVFNSDTGEVACQSTVSDEGGNADEVQAQLNVNHDIEHRHGAYSFVEVEPKVEDVEMRLATFEDIQELPVPLQLCDNLPLISAASHSAVRDQPPPVPKLPLPRKPTIWAQTRQEVCESFPWFRSFQGGVYHNDNVVKGYLLSGHPAERDRFEQNGKFIISHGGGKSESMAMQDGKLTVVPAQDQSENDRSVRALLHTYLEKRPIVLLLDDNYRLFPYDLKAHGIVYAVLGLYFIKHAWAERQPAGPSTPGGTVVRFKFAFQWCEGQDAPWWSPPPLELGLVTPKPERDTPSCPIEPATTDARRRPPVPKRKKKRTNFVALGQICQRPDRSYLCPTCGKRSTLVYRSHICLYPQCQAFWLVDGVHPVAPNNLKANPDLATLDDPCWVPENMRDVRPPPPVKLDLLCKPGITTTEPFTQGWHCKQCGRLSCRTYWDRWECPACNAPPVPVNALIRDAKDFACLPTKVKMDWLHSKVYSKGDIERLPMRPFTNDEGIIIGNYQAFKFTDGSGTLYHIKSTTIVGQQEAQHVFRQYQLDANSGSLNFQRLPLRSHKLRGACLAHYFSHNTGKPYHYVGGGANTTPWKQAPEAVLAARELMHKRIRQALGRQESFNEVLSAAYMESQKMAFHSDAEAGLGPLVAGLSLGAPAFMHFRRVPKTKEALDGQKGILLSFKLEHGDILVMDGPRIQLRYQHTVVPTNFRIAATARQIGD
ncbi:uncharacterized protein SCHCODRAFT_02632122 [Schizophyllum commune H4-8]|uniref:uncharacterized protein n=1 Tax=Schizophyllum commune (strain H4-8 / FGSC 9210) TaxID=578458 RepID=UPI00215FA0BF|nr:uncharacterized protein SCHCODRAFT_02632122 [Schizophyllum commune H4-8]KAI5890533.1 hypothetical protein SCHCODRAFT_02632122 [Schizophyllum commune H4-8]